jgi:hypothetical protein
LLAHLQQPIVDRIPLSKLVFHLSGKGPVDVLGKAVGLNRVRGEFEIGRNPQQALQASPVVPECLLPGYIAYLRPPLSKTVRTFQTSSDRPVEVSDRIHRELGAFAFCAPPPAKGEGQILRRLEPLE